MFESEATLGEPTVDRIFVVHGRDESVRVGMFGLLRAFGLWPLEWSEALAMTGDPNPFIGDVLDLAFRTAGAIVVLFTPDDLASLKPHLAVGGILTLSEHPQVRRDQTCCLRQAWQWGGMLGEPSSLKSVR